MNRHQFKVNLFWFNWRCKLRIIIYRQKPFSFLCEQSQVHDESVYINMRHKYSCSLPSYQIINTRIIFLVYRHLYQCLFVDQRIFPKLLYISFKLKINTHLVFGNPGPRRESAGRYVDENMNGWTSRNKSFDFDKYKTVRFSASHKIRVRLKPSPDK